MVRAGRVAIVKETYPYQVNDAWRPLSKLAMKHAVLIAMQAADARLPAFVSIPIVLSILSCYKFCCWFSIRPIHEAWIITDIPNV